MYRLASLRDAGDLRKAERTCASEQLGLTVSRKRLNVRMPETVDEYAISLKASVWEVPMSFVGSGKRKKASPVTTGTLDDPRYGTARFSGADTSHAPTIHCHPGGI